MLFNKIQGCQIGLLVAFWAILQGHFAMQNLNWHLSANWAIVAFKIAVFELHVPVLSNLAYKVFSVYT